MRFGAGEGALVNTSDLSVLAIDEEQKPSPIWQKVRPSMSRLASWPIDRRDTSGRTPLPADLVQRPGFVRREQNLPGAAPSSAESVAGYGEFLRTPAGQIRAHKLSR